LRYHNNDGEFELTVDEDCNICIVGDECVLPEEEEEEITAPGAAESLTAGSVSSSSLTFSWSAPSSDGGSPVTYYYLYWD